jgi:TRAP-type C4-dicarboxylate transport system substrate-binding protein
MAFSETFTAVQQKTVDGLEITASAINTSGFYEVCKYLSLTRHFYSPIAINISRVIWDDLTEEEQGWFQEAATKTKNEQRLKVQAIERDLLNEMGKVIAINEVADIESFRDATKSAYDLHQAKGRAMNLLNQILKKVGVLGGAFE